MRRLPRDIRDLAYEELFEIQEGQCAICGRTDVKLCVDHDHKDGRIRGLLCHACNTKLGEFERYWQLYYDYLMDTSRTERDWMYLETARMFSRQATCYRAQVGTVIVSEGRIIAHGYNGAPPGMPHCVDVGCLIGPDGGCTRSVHAEVNALGFAARQGIAPVGGSTVYSTHAPCSSCARLLLTAGIVRLRYMIEYRDPSGVELLKDAGVRLD